MAGSPVYRRRHGPFKDLPWYSLAVTAEGLQHQTREVLMDTEQGHQDQLINKHFRLRNAIFMMAEWKKGKCNSLLLVQDIVAGRGFSFLLPRITITGGWIELLFYSAAPILCLSNMTWMLLGVYVHSWPWQRVKIIFLSFDFAAFHLKWVCHLCLRSTVCNLTNTADVLLFLFANPHNPKYWYTILTTTLSMAFIALQEKKWRVSFAMGLWDL